MKKKVELTISIVGIMIISVVASSYIFAQGKNISKNVEIRNVSDKKKEIGIETQQLRKEKIESMIEKYFPKDIDRSYGFPESRYMEKDLDRTVEDKGTPTALKSPELSEDEIITTYSNGFMGKVVIFKKRGEEYIPIWESPLRYMGYFIMVDEVRDINNDGQKEIIISGAVGARGYPGIWIYSWDGNSGRLISPTWHNGRSTELVSSAGFYSKEDIKDINGDKIDEVIIHRYISNPEGGLDPIGVEKEIYKWNSTNQIYELWKTELERGKSRTDFQQEE